MKGKELEQAPASGSKDPLYWGSVELLSFLCLFLSPWLGARAVEVLWLALVCWRAALVGGWLFSSPVKTLRAKLTGLGRGLAYGLPFWVSALLFPLRQDQAEVLLPALGFYLALVVCVVLLSLTTRAWYAAQISLLTALWFSWFEPSALSASGIPLAFTPLLWGQPNLGPRSWEKMRWGLLSATAGWAFCLLLAELGGDVGLEPLARGMMLWLLVVLVSQQAVFKARREQEEGDSRELEFSLPGLAAGLSWLHARSLWKLWAPWAPMVPLAVWDQGLLWVAVLAILAFFGLVSLTAKGFVSSLQLQWWACAQFVVIWGAVEGRGPYRFAWILVAGLLLMALRRSQGQSGVFEFEGRASRGILEARLRQELIVKAPLGMSQEILKAVEPSVDLDVSLSAEAPVGFRQRLLQRLKHAENDHDEES